ncbi:hypothetical protein [Dethiosulfatarculus sandiegensis]|uniref:Tail fiber protein n=1 Tax=Dethiosulfatarculus sandiegensis TaxID=1429043 RepID=A0A0D2JFD1_9BACT|nr:hypothetical protein [Dethiosulfatarculus sandiegensis]KIX14421.1 hypothetical protein X474_09770 [Dethiosulfatarculus sandiegensis]
MHRIDGSGHQDNHFTEGNPQTGTEATVVTADWLNSVQEEVAHVIEGQNLALDKDDNEQLKTAVNTAIGQAVANCKTEVALDRASEIDAAKNEISGLIDQKVDAGIGAVKQRHIIRWSVSGYAQVADSLLTITPGISCKTKRVGAVISGTGAVGFSAKVGSTALWSSSIDSSGGAANTGTVYLTELDAITISLPIVSGEAYDFRGFILVEEL